MKYSDPQAAGKYECDYSSQWVINKRTKTRSEGAVPGDVLHFVDEGLVPHGVEGLGLGGGAVQVVLVRVDRHVRVYRLVVYNPTPYLHTL